MERKYNVGILGGTGFVGQRFVTLLEGHPWFDIKVIAASGRSEGKTYAEAVGGRWKLDVPMPSSVSGIIVKNVSQIKEICDEVDFVFCAVDMQKDEIRRLEEEYARNETPVISNNSAHRYTPDVPMVIPEVNPGHIAVIEFQRRRLGTRSGFIAVKPNCSIQSYVPALHALMEYKPQKVMACTYQAISGSGKVFADWPEISDNIIPYIGGEEEKSEKEPLKIWGRLDCGKIECANIPVISSQCIRVPVSDGHLAAVSVTFERKPPVDEIINKWNDYTGLPQKKKLPSAPNPFLKYFCEPDRPQTAVDRGFGGGMGITLGRLREDCLFDYKFICLSHNTIRGAAGGGILTAELLASEGYLRRK